MAAGTTENFLDKSNQLQPLGDKVLVRRDPKVKEIRGIILAEAHQPAGYLGTVLAVGPGVDTKCPHCGRYGRIASNLIRPGDRVILPELGGQEIRDWDEGPPLVIIEEGFLHGRVI